MSDIAIRVDNLSKQYRIGQRKPYKTVRESIQNLFRAPPSRSGAAPADQTFWALKDVSFEVKQGEVVGIIGRNGAGKSTLLKVLSRITEPTTGQVETTGRVGSLLEVGTGFHPELTGRENVYLNGAILGMRKAEIAGKFDEIVAFAEVDRFLDTPVKYYSSGMYTRLAFAVAAHLEPAILVVDEVLAVGDAQFQKKCLGKMGEVAKGGRTVLFVSHNMGAILTLCQRTIVLRGGKVAAICDPPAGVREYLAGDSQQQALGARNFTGTLTDRLHFTSMAVNPGLERANAFSPNEPLRLEVEGMADAEIPAFRVTFSIYTQGTRLLTLHDVPVPTTLPAGRFRSTVEIPPLLLRPGEYSLAIGGYRDGMNEWIWGTDLMQFSVLEEWGPNFDPINIGLVNVPMHGTRELAFSGCFTTAPSRAVSARFCGLKPLRSDAGGVTLDLQAKQTEHEGSWQPGYGAFAEVVRSHGLRRGAEIGVAFGGHSENILLNTEVERLYGVDSYRHRPDYFDPMNLPQPQFDELCEKTRQRLSRFGDRFNLIREDSVAGAKAISEQLDFVYLDADHSYEGVAADLCAWYAKIREGGILAGHDYGHMDFPGVKRAVDEFFRRLGGTVQVVGDRVWWIQKCPSPVSFFMPAYNCAKTIAESVESIMETNKREIDELVIVDDGSSDGTHAVLDDLNRRFPDIRVLHHPRNRGGAAARNTACEAAKGQLLFCLDSDNLLAPSSIAPLLEAMLSSGCDAAAFEECRYFNEKETPGSVLTWRFKRGVQRFPDFLLTPVVPGASGNYLFSKESWIRAGGYPEAAGALDTWGFGLRQMATGSSIYVLPNTFYHHRYGYDSYFVRWRDTTPTSLIALSLLIPYLNQIDKRDINYLFSKRGRENWHARLEQRPIRVVTPRPYHRKLALEHRFRMALPPSVRKAFRSVWPRQEK